MITPTFIMCMVGVLMLGLTFEHPMWRLAVAAFMLWASVHNIPPQPGGLPALIVYLTT